MSDQAKKIESSNVIQQSLLDDDDTKFEELPETPVFSDDTSRQITTQDDDGGDDFDIEIVDPNAPEEPAPSEASETNDADAAPKTPAEEEPSGRSDQGRYQERIDQLTYQARQTERERDEAVGVARTLIDKVKTLENQLKTSNVSQYETLKNAAENAVRVAETEYAEAFETQDAKKIAAAQRKLSTATGHLALLEQRPLRSAPKADPAPTATTTTTTTPTAAPERPRIDPRTTAWLQDNPWFQRRGEEERTQVAYAISENLTAQGIEVGSEEYFKRIDARLREVFPDKFRNMDANSKTTEKTTEGSPASSRPPVAGGGRQAPSGQRRKVRLTQSQLNIAKELGLTAKQYAAQLIQEES